jgi:hypothetical protein
VPAFWWRSGIESGMLLVDLNLPLDAETEVVLIAHWFFAVRLVPVGVTKFPIPIR